MGQLFAQGVQHAANQATKKREFCGLRAAAIIALSALLHAPFNNAAAQEQTPSQVPQLIYMTRQGLDVQKNPIDRLINIFGFVCIHIWLSPPQCRFEKELVKFLSSFPTPEALVHEVTALGAICEHSIERWTCKYERTVEHKNWISGRHEPVSIADEHFRIDFSVISDAGELSYSARLNRKTEVKEQRAPY